MRNFKVGMKKAAPPEQNFQKQINITQTNTHALMHTPTHPLPRTNETILSHLPIDRTFDTHLSYTFHTKAKFVKLFQILCKERKESYCDPSSVHLNFGAQIWCLTFSVVRELENYPFTLDQPSKANQKIQYQNGYQINFLLTIHLSVILSFDDLGPGRFIPIILPRSNFTATS